MNVLALCAGAGGLELGVQLARPDAHAVCYVEREAYAAGTLVARMEAGQLAPAPVWSDLATFDARPWRGRIHCVTSGDPCQENSVAGRGLGAAGARFLAPEVVRIAYECRPDRIFRENVPGNADGQLEAIVPALERLGYRVAAGIFSAAGVGASHRRERLFIMADRFGRRQPQHAQFDGGSIGGRQSLSGGGHPLRRDHYALVDAASVRRGEGRPEHELWSGRGSASQPGRELGISDSPYLQGRRSGRDPGGRQEPVGHVGLAGRSMVPILCPGPSDRSWPDIIARAPHLEPAVRRMAHGLANRVDRLRLCGNGVHPLAAGYAWLALDALLAEAAASDAVVRSAA